MAHSVLVGSDSKKSIREVVRLSFSDVSVGGSGSVVQVVSSTAG